MVPFFCRAHGHGRHFREAHEVELHHRLPGGLEIHRLAVDSDLDLTAPKQDYVNSREKLSVLV